MNQKSKPLELSVVYESYPELAYIKVIPQGFICNLSFAGQQ